MGATPEEKLALAVLHRAVLDARGVMPCQKGRTSTRVQRADGLDFIREPNDAFDYWARVAGLSPTFAREMCLKALNPAVTIPHFNPEQL